MWNLPDGKSTADVSEYADAWVNLYKPLEDALNLKVIGFDPLVMFQGANFEGPLVQMPVWMVQRIRALIEENKNLKNLEES
jgi:hypothetical protein